MKKSIRNNTRNYFRAVYPYTYCEMKLCALFILTSQQGDTNLCAKPLPDAES